MNNSNSQGTTVSEHMESSQSLTAIDANQRVLGSSVTDQGPADSQALSDYLPSRKTMGLVGVIAAGLTLIGATTYFVATRFVRKRKGAK